MALIVPSALINDTPNTSVVLNIEWLALLASVMDIYADQRNFETGADLSGWNELIDYVTETIDDE